MGNFVCNREVFEHRLVFDPETGRSEAESPWKGKNILELGSGTGILAPVFAKLGATIVVTDLPEILPAMKVNIDFNTKDNPSLQQNISIRSLDWSKPVPDSVRLVNWDYIVACDVVYNPSLYDILSETIKSVCGQETLCLLAYQPREAEREKRFFASLAHFFHISKVR